MAFARPRTEAGVRIIRSAIVTEVRPSAVEFAKTVVIFRRPRLNNASLHFAFAFSPISTRRTPLSDSPE